MSPYQICGTVVAARIHSLAPNPGELSPFGRAALARLRRGVGKPPGSVPQIWDLTLDGLAQGRGLTAERREIAVHVALTQWAMHQQSKTTPMHSPDRSFGEGLRLLARSQKPEAPQDTPAYRRMMALASSRSLAGITTHSRGLISQLRGIGVAFDYARWADDLYWLQVPGRMTEVQRRWGRDFYRLRDEDVATQLNSISEQPTIQEEAPA